MSGNLGVGEGPGIASLSQSVSSFAPSLAMKELAQRN